MAARCGRPMRSRSFRRSPVAPEPGAGRERRWLGVAWARVPPETAVPPAAGGDRPDASTAVGERSKEAGSVARPHASEETAPAVATDPAPVAVSARVRPVLAPAAPAPATASPTKPPAPVQ